ncbi:MAG: pitrilysin family protein [Oligoflexia bacterium]|nr:pitrilysin family protein [Oligoflexia bacterium]
MKVLLVESHKAPVVAVQMWVKTGSADEKKDEEGISHFIEHLVFKGTSKFGVGEVAKTVESSGGELNAYTTFDHTVFHVTMSKEELDVGLDCIAEMMGFPKFDPVEIDKEREVVLEEIKRSFDNPHSISMQRLFSTVFKKHPYGIPVIGYAKNIKKVKPKTLVKYYQSRYVPTNMTLVVTGDFDKTEIKKQIEKYYGAFKAHSLKKIARKKESPQKQPRVDYLTTEFQEAALNIAFRVPAAKNADVAALDVLGCILGQGDSSRLVKRLRLERSLVMGVSAGSFNPLDEGLFVIGVNAKAENISETMDIITQELGYILSHTISQGELSRARLNLEAEEIFSLETVDGLARKVGMFQTLLNDPEYIQRYLKQVQALTPKDILRVARKYLSPERSSVTLMIHKKETSVLPKKKFQEQVKALLKQLKTSQKQKVSVDKEKVQKSQTLKVPLKMSVHHSKIVKHRLPNGALVVLKRNPEVPIVHIKAGFLGGVRLEKDHNQGVTTLLSNTWTSGSRRYTESETASIIEDCAGSISAFGGRNSIGMTLESLKIHEERALTLFEDVLSNPIFPQEAVLREASIQKEHLRTRGDHPSSVAGQIFMDKIFKDHPYGRDLLGTNESISKLGTDSILEHWKKIVSSDNAVFVAVGDFDEDKQLKFFQEMCKGIGRGQKQESRFDIAPLTENIHAYSRSEKEQSHIIVGYRGISFKDPDRYALQVLQAILAGQGGRLFLELRDKASLAYTVSPVHMDGIETGYFGVYIGCSPEKGKTAIKMIHQELDLITQKAPSDDEVERAKRYLVGQNHIGLQRNGSQASSILFDELYGIDCMDTFRFAEHLKELKAQDVQRVAQRLFNAPYVTVAVGPEQPW